MASHHHKHHHQEVSGKNLGLSILLNVSITIAEAIGGFISGSMALLSDATHNLSDVISLLISLIANKLTKKKATTNYTYGFRRSEIVAAFVNSGTLIVLALMILVNGVKRLYHPEDIDANWVIWLAIASIAVNGISVLFIKKDAEKNINIKSAYLHLFSDMLTSIAVLIGGLCIKFFGWTFIDQIFSIGIAIYLIIVSWQIFKSALKIIMQFTPEDIKPEEIASEIAKINNVKNIHHIHIWQINEHDIMLEAHIDLNQDIKISNYEKIMQQIKEILKRHNISHSTLQPEFSTDDNKQLVISH